MNTARESPCVQNNEAGPSTSSTAILPVSTATSDSANFKNNEAGPSTSSTALLPVSTATSDSANIQNNEAGPSTSSTALLPVSTATSDSANFQNNEAGPGTSSTALLPVSTATSDSANFQNNEAGPSTSSDVSNPVPTTTPKVINLQRNEASTSTSMTFRISSPTGTSETNINTQRDQAGPSTSTVVNISGTTQRLPRILHAHFRWTIENFSLFPDCDDKYCLSPTFELETTYWSLALHPKPKIHGDDTISLNLIRMKTEQGPRWVRVSYRLGLECHNNKVWFTQRECIGFGKGDSDGIHTSLLGNLEDFRSDGLENNKDSISILCEMYVVYDSEVFMVAEDRQYSSVDSFLSTNLLHFFHSKPECDILILSSNSSFRAHRAVLSARSRTLSRLLEDGKPSIQLCCTHLCLYCALVYMYSGSFRYVAQYCRISIGMYELACELSLSKLKDLLKPYKVENTSRILLENSTIVWTLENFNIADIFGEDITSTYYLDPETRISYAANLRKIGNTDYIELNVGLCFLGLAFAVRFSFEIYLLVKESEPFEKVPPFFHNMRFNGSEFSFTAHFLVIDVLRTCYFDEKNLKFYMQCERLSLTQVSHLDSTLQIKSPINLEALWREDLSNDLKQLWYSGNLSDVTLKTPDALFEVHRCILAARSSHFNKLFTLDQCRNETLKGKYIESRILYMLLMFVYTGKFTGITFSISKLDVLDLYQWAEIFSITSLKIICERQMSMSFDDYFVLSVLFDANRFKNIRLRKACLDYMARRNAEIKVTEPSVDTDEKGLTDSDDSNEESIDDSDEDDELGEDANDDELGEDANDEYDEFGEDTYDDEYDESGEDVNDDESGEGDDNDEADAGEDANKDEDIGKDANKSDGTKVLSETAPS